MPCVLLIVPVIDIPTGIKMKVTSFENIDIRKNMTLFQNVSFYSVVD